MPFVWNDKPNPPSVDLPVPVADGEISYEQAEVANNVNVHPIYGVGTLRWNIATPPDEGDNGLFGDFDIIYELPSLNVKDLHVTHLEAGNLTVGFAATINTANISTATINTANIVNATLTNSVMGMHPSANLQIATKEYVDALAANSLPLGGNLQLLIQAAGDLLVGVSDNTAERLAVGTEGQVLQVGGVGNTGLRWAGPLGSSSTHRGMVIGTSMGGVLKNTQIILTQTDEITMNDGMRISSGWNGLTASILSNVETSGVGHLDTGVVLPNTCYEIYAIRSSSNGAQGLLLHRAKEFRVDGTHYPDVTNYRSLNFDAGFTRSLTVNVAQKFVVANSGPFIGVDLTMTRIGTPAGNCWVTLEPNGPDNNTTGVVLATSRKVNAVRIGNSSIGTDSVRVRFPFDTPANVVSGNLYWMILHSDYAVANNVINPHYVRVHGDLSAPGVPYAIGASKFFNANTNGWAFSNSAATIDLGTVQGPANLYFRTFVEANDSPVILPTGYDQFCLISYCSTTHLSILREYHQREYRMSMPLHYTWCYHNNSVYAPNVDAPANNAPMLAQASEPVHMGAFIPPIPCLVWLYKYTALSGSAIVSVGNYTCTDFLIQLPLESDGSSQATVASSQWYIMGPILAEYGGHNTMAGGGTTAAMYVAGIEF
jgi:hypothetical protein